MQVLIAPAYCTLLCTIKWSLRAGLNWNGSKVENILPRANMHSAPGTRLQLVWHHTSNSPSHPECECHFLSINFVSVLVLLCFPTCSFRLACHRDQFLYISRQTAMEKSLSQVWEKWKVLFYITSYVVRKLPLVPLVVLTESKPHIRFILQISALREISLEASINMRVLDTVNTRSGRWHVCVTLKWEWESCYSCCTSS